VDGVVFFGRIGASELEDDSAAAGVFGKEACYIVDIAVEDYPTALCCVVLCDCWYVSNWFSAWAVKLDRPSAKSNTFVILQISQCTEGRTKRDMYKLQK
jgi:hypothetical protein